MARTTFPTRSLAGALVALPARGRRLDGFWRHDAARRGRLFVLVHGMGGNFYRSALKKELMARLGEADCDVLSFDNRGSGEGVNTERFSDCLADLDAALAFGRRAGYRRFVLGGHSTGCQKIAYFQLRRRDPAVEALIHLAPGDDQAILRRDLGAAGMARMTARARRRVRAGKGDEPVSGGGGFPEFCRDFSARRLLSIADPARAEAQLFHFEGGLRLFSRLRLPMLVLFGSREEFACLPLRAMRDRLASATRSERFEWVTIRGADHGFHGHERAAADAVIGFLHGQGSGRGTRT